MNQSKRVRFISTRSGVSSLGNLMLLIAALLVGLAAYLFIPPTFSNFKLGNMFRSIAANSGHLENAEQVKLLALQELNLQGYHFQPEQLKVAKQGKRVRLRVEYTVDVQVPLTDIVFNISYDQEDGNDNITIDKAAMKHRMDE